MAHRFLISHDSPVLYITLVIDIGFQFFALTNSKK